MFKIQFYRFMSHITGGKIRKKYRRKYKELRQPAPNGIYQIMAAQRTIIDQMAQMIRNIDFKQNLFFDYFLDASAARHATGALAKRQSENLYLLREFVAICKKHKLDYWLDFGTLLGAMRHNGFVPWDDDIDVSMRREDLVKFRDAFQAESKKDLNFLFWDGRQSRLVFAENTGAFLDIYAYDQENDKMRPVPIFPIKSYNTQIPLEIIYPFSKIDFCGVRVNAPHNADAYLRIKYGNYLLLPKQAHSVGGHNSLDEYAWGD